MSFAITFCGVSFNLFFSFISFLTRSHFLISPEWLRLREWDSRRDQCQMSPFQNNAFTLSVSPWELTRWWRFQLQCFSSSYFCRINKGGGGGIILAQLSSVQTVHPHLQNLNVKAYGMTCCYLCFPDHLWIRHRKKCSALEKYVNATKLTKKYQCNKYYYSVYDTVRSD